MNGHRFSLDGRLSLIASLVRKNGIAVDVGTDHGYLPLWLILEGICPKVIAVDVNEQPLCAARKNAEKYSLPDGAFDLRLSDGLLAVGADEADDVIIAGMGGELMAEIIGKAEYLKCPDKHLILQPMSSAEELREYLYSAGFFVAREPVVECGKHVYSVMDTYYAGDKRALTDAERLVGSIFQNGDEASRKYMEAKQKAVEKKLHGAKIKGDSEEIERLSRLFEELGRL